MQEVNFINGMRALPVKITSFRTILSANGTTILGSYSLRPPLIWGMEKNDDTREVLRVFIRPTVVDHPDAKAIRAFCLINSVPTARHEG